MRILPHMIMVAASLGLSLSSCSETNGDPTAQATVYDIVCLANVDDTGSEYTLTKPNGKEIITYRSRESMDTNRIKKGSRFMLAYIPAGGIPYVSGMITPIGYSPVTNDTLRHGYISKIDGWDNDPVYMLSSWMSQDYLNIRARLPFDSRPRSLGVMVDSLTLDREYPDCYLIHRLESPISTFERSYYLSFDMTSLRKLKRCRGFNLLLNNSNLTVDKLTFELK